VKTAVHLLDSNTESLRAGTADFFWFEGNFQHPVYFLLKLLTQSKLLIDDLNSMKKKL
jgi:hypothetical protein